MSIPTISTLPTPPTRSDAANFAVRADAFMAALPTFQSQTNSAIGAMNAFQVRAPFRNRLINGDMRVDQRNGGAAQTITNNAALAYTVDQWYAFCAGANVTGQRVNGANAGLRRYQFTGAASVTSIVFGQRIESANSADLAGTTATLSVDLSNSLLTTVTWTAHYATTTDAFGTRASPTRTQIATGTWTVTSTVTRYAAQISIPAAAVTGIEIVLSVGAQTSGTWIIGDVQLEPGNITGGTPFDRRPLGVELAICQRYYEKSYAPETTPSTNTAVGATYTAVNGSASILNHGQTDFFRVTKRASATLRYWDLVGTENRTTSFTGGGFVQTNGNNNVAAYTGSATSGQMRISAGSELFYAYHWTAEAVIP